MATKKAAAPKVSNPEALAIVEIGSHQYKVKTGDIISVEKLSSAKGDKFTLDQVLVYSDADKTVFGAPFVDGAKVEVENLDTIKDEKIRIARFRAKSRYRKLKGHRQQKTQLKVLSVSI